jgi:CelD/BcsL family acetyltransferase involved in cellulose biosynthesis
MQIIKPLLDARWDELVERHPRSSVFHVRGWLEALHRTYGYEPCAFTNASPNETLKDGVLGCRVSSWITGTRLVSLPFADHCEPLLNSEEDFQESIDYIREKCDELRWRYVEFRPFSGLVRQTRGLDESNSFWVHELDTKPSLDMLARQLHKNSFQRKIRRAAREGLSYERGRSSEIVDEFYRLLLMTRKRHHLFPQPRKWFRNLMVCMAEKLQIALVRKGGVAIAAILTLRHRSCMVYKYGCSDKRYHRLGGMPFLFWKLIEQCKESGIEMIDLGRSDFDNPGLTLFKDRLGAARRPLTYYRYTNPKMEKRWNWKPFHPEGLLSILPDNMLSTAGGLVYRHIG